MKKLLITLFSALLVLAVTKPIAAQEDITVPLSKPGQNGMLRIDLVYADDIVVETHDRQDVIVRYNGDDDDDDWNNRKNGLRRISSGGLSLEITEDNNVVKINSQPQHNDLELTVYVPKNFSLKLNAVHGDVEVRGLEGEVEIESVNGDVEVMNISGSALVNSVNGDIEVSFVKIDPKAPMSFTGVNGDIEVSIPEGAKFSAKMKTDWGDVYTNFDMNIERNPTDTQVSSKKGQYKVSINKWVYGTVNGGGPEYLFKTLHGDIEIRKN
ncbi:MAG: DUF4097 family beta strand repeat-containing protein [Balneola sp.]